MIEERRIECQPIELGGRSIPVRLRRNGAARRIILRIDQERDGVVLTLPKWAREAEALARYVERGGTLLATGDTGTLDNEARPRSNFALANLTS